MPTRCSGEPEKDPDKEVLALRRKFWPGILEDWNFEAAVEFR
jgi:hypothetical protein